MAINAVSGLAPDWFEPVQDEVGPVARFQLRHLSGFEFAGVIVDLKVSGEAGYRGLVQKAVIGWENVFDENGNALPFSTKNLEKIPAITLLEIGDEVYRRSILAEEQRKNSSSQSKSAATQKTSIAPPATTETAI